MLGGSGVMIPAPVAIIGRKIIDHFKQNNIKMAIEYQQKFYLFPGIWIKYGLAPLMKLAMKYIGLDLGEPYPPFQPIPTEEIKIIESVLEKLGITTIVR
jgi:Dihydrodipicolinate synthase/N-acetylneuraminate lyase